MSTITVQEIQSDPVAFLQRVEALPRDARLLLLAAAAEPVGDLSLLWRAADRLVQPVSGVVDRVGDRLEQVQLLQPMDQNSSADPQHRRGADERQGAEQLGDDMDQAQSERA